MKQTFWCWRCFTIQSWGCFITENVWWKWENHHAARALSKAKCIYSQIKKEALTKVHAVKKFHQYFFGRHFLLYADHKPLLWLLLKLKGIASMAATCIQRRDILLSAQNYSLKYRSGSVVFLQMKKFLFSKNWSIHDRTHPCPIYI